jgi:putative ABC transport system ATP-binding protein
VIRFEGVWRSYVVGGEEVHALAGIDEEIVEGEHLAIMGPSGSGKSTLLNLIGCLDRPTRGSYLLDGREVARLSEAQLSEVRQSSIGYVFQSYHLISRLDALGNVELPMIFAGVPRKVVPVFHNAGCTPASCIVRSMTPSRSTRSSGGSEAIRWCSFTPATSQCR